MKGYILLQLGRTHIRAGAFEEDGRVIGKYETFPSYPTQSREIILGNLARIISDLYAGLMDAGIDIAGVGMAVPGPFDIEKGVPLMFGLGKYDAIYGVCLHTALRKTAHEAGLPFPCQETPFVYVGDTEAMALGVRGEEYASAANKVIFVMITGGVGSAFMENGRFLRGGEEDVPENGWIYCMPFLHSIVDDYLSIRGLISYAASKHYTQSLPTLEQLRAEVRRDEARALYTYLDFGKLLAQGLEPYIVKFLPDLLVIGGDIAEDFDYCGQALRSWLNAIGVRLAVCEDTHAQVTRGLLQRFHPQQQPDPQPVRRADTLRRGKGEQALYVQIANVLRAQIDRGEYADNDIIPSEKQLQERFMVSRMTIRQAIAMLVNAGYLACYRGIGTIVTKSAKQDGAATP